MKIGIVGCGAMGSVYAGLLADAGNEVWAVDQWAEHIEAMREHGLRVEGASGDRTVHLNATTVAAEAGVCELVVIATKAMNVTAAATAARPMVGPGTLVLSIQNGLGGPARAVAALPGAHVAIGVAGGFGASILKPGRAHHNGWELVRLGEVEGPVTPALAAVAELWRAAGFRTETDDDIQRMVWEKLICNVAFSGTCALTALTIGQVIADPGAWRVASTCAAEAHGVARAQGIAVRIEDPVAHVHDFGLKIPHAHPSMLLDHQARRRSEIDAINGAIPPAGREAGVPAPMNEAVADLVRAKEAGF